MRESDEMRERGSSECLLVTVRSQGELARILKLGKEKSRELVRFVTDKEGEDHEVLPASTICRERERERDG
ncbi:hypothetical protein CDL15_Pgr005309 [Punica granatum]|uniref:Uncharacterized protein n=1 Tax=Punica granatum TaxID=22663 RepID=A0A218XDY9_PUNGR|nr:hypothetical protein CDL15_Pgr005309 [Punica granatum]